MHVHCIPLCHCDVKTGGNQLDLLVGNVLTWLSCAVCPIHSLSNIITMTPLTISISGNNRIYTTMFQFGSLLRTCMRL